MRKTSSCLQGRPRTNEPLVVSQVNHQYSSVLPRNLHITALFYFSAND